MSIRRMEQADHEALIALWRSFPGNAVTGADGKEGFSAFLARNADFCYVIEEHDKVLGSVMAAHDGRRGYIYHLAVDTSRQGRGYGKALMERAEAALAAAGIEKAHLFIFSDNPAVGFYERTGWHLRRDIEVMSKVLSGSDPLMGTRQEPED